MIGGQEWNEECCRECATWMAMGMWGSRGVKGRRVVVPGGTMLKTNIGAAVVAQGAFGEGAQSLSNDQLRSLCRRFEKVYLA